MVIHFNLIMETQRKVPVTTHSNRTDTLYGQLQCHTMPAVLIGYHQTDNNQFVYLCTDQHTLIEQSEI